MNVGMKQLLKLVWLTITSESILNCVFKSKQSFVNNNKLIKLGICNDRSTVKHIRKIYSAPHIPFNDC